MGIRPAHTDHLTADPEQEDIGVSGTEKHHGGSDPHGTVDTRQLHQQLIHLIGHIHKVRQQRMTVDVIAEAPVRQYHIGQGIIARQMEIVDEQLEVIPNDLLEHVPMLCYQQSVEECEQREDDCCPSPLLTPDVK